MKAVTRRIHNKQAKLVEQRLQCSSINLHKHQSFDAAAQPPEQKDIGHNQTAATISNTTQHITAALLIHSKWWKELQKHSPSIHLHWRLERSPDKGKRNLPCPLPPACWSWQCWSSSPAKPSSRNRRSSPAWGLWRRRYAAEVQVEKWEEKKKWG